MLAPLFSPKNKSYKVLPQLSRRITYVWGSTFLGLHNRITERRVLSLLGEYSIFVLVNTVVVQGTVKLCFQEEFVCGGSV